MSGYSQEALDEITDGHRLEIILLDQSHWDAMLDGRVSPARVLALARAHAAFRGEAYVPIQGLLESSLPVPKTDHAPVLATKDSEIPEFGRLLLPAMVGIREIRDPASGDAVAAYTDASILFYLIEHFVKVGAVDVVVNEGVYAGAIPMLPPAFRSRLIEINHAHSIQSVLRICEPIAGEFGAEIDAAESGIRSIHYHVSLPNAVSEALTTLILGLGEYIHGMRHGLIVTLDLSGMRTAISTLLELVSSRESRANLVTVEQVFSTYQPYAVGGPIIKSMASARLVEIFNDLVINPLYLELSCAAAKMGVATEVAESANAVSTAARRLTDRDAALNFGRYDAFIAPGPRRDAESQIDAHFSTKYFPPIVPIGEAYIKAKAAWQRDKPDFIPLWSDSGGNTTELPPGAHLV